MEEFPDAKIWKYMDLAKFLSLLTTSSLYFASPAQFQDLSEGTLPKSHAAAMSKMLQDTAVNPILRVREEFAALSPHALKEFDHLVQKRANDQPRAQREATLRFGVNCWHKSEYESEAMWKLYSSSGQSVAVESTIGQLRASLGNREGIVIDSVRYADFDKDPIEKGHKHYALFMKRASFEYEKELRATILLPVEQWQLPPNTRGISVGCDLQRLISRVHVSPICEPFVVSAVERLCSGHVSAVDKPVIQSRLLQDEGYDITVDLPGDLAN
jgi:hypothetical protein